jgi:hypothetical protein
MPDVHCPLRLRLAGSGVPRLGVAAASGVRQPVPRRVKDFIEISEYTSLDTLIRFLETVRDTLPENCEPELRIRGDEIFGRRLTISYLRELTGEEAAIHARYNPETVPESDPELDKLRQQLDAVPYETPESSS